MNLSNIFNFNDVPYTLSSTMIDPANILMGMTGVEWAWGVNPTYYRYSDGTIDTFFELKSNEWYVRFVINKNFTGSIHASSTLFGYNVGNEYFVGDNQIPLNTVTAFKKGDTYEMRFITHSSDGTPVVNERGDLVSFVYLKLNTGDLSFNPMTVLTGMAACEWSWGSQLNSYKYSDGTIDAILEFRENEGYASFTFNKDFTGSIHASSTLFGYNIGNEYFIGDNQIPLNNVTEFHSGETYEMRFTIHGSDSGSPIVNERGDMIAFVYLKSDVVIPNEAISKINVNGVEYTLTSGEKLEILKHHFQFTIGAKATSSTTITLPDGAYPIGMSNTGSEGGNVRPPATRIEMTKSSGNAVTIAYTNPFEFSYGASGDIFYTLTPWE